MNHRHHEGAKRTDMPQCPHPRAQRSPPIQFVRTLLSLCVVLNVHTASAGNPYEGICQRNAFHLKPAQTVLQQTLPGPLPRVHLTGITTILQGKRALLKVEFPAKPQEKPKEESYILTEGQRVGSIEVLKINEKRDLVTIDDAGTVTNITFEKIVSAQVPAKPQPIARWGMQYRAVKR